MSNAARHDTEQDARASLVATCRRLDAARLNTARAGNLSLAWDRGAIRGVLLTPSAMRYEDMGADDIAWMPIDQPLDQAEIRSGVLSDAPSRNEPIAWPIDLTIDQSPADTNTPPALAGLPARYFGPRAPSSEWRMHLALYQNRPEVGSVLHVHSTYATTLACLPRIQTEGIPAFHYMVAVAGGDDIRCAPYALFGSIELTEAMLAVMNQRRACLLANHGMIVAAADLAGAFELAQEVETLARVYWQTLQVGEPQILSAAQMQAVHQQFAASAYRKP